LAPPDFGGETVIFSRKRGSGRHAAPKRERDDFDDVVDTDDDETTSARDVGPYDIDDVSGDPEGLDLGSLRVPVPPGVELRVQADPDGQIQQVLLASGESVLQVGVFAAPRSEGIWDEVREDIRKQLYSDGVAAEEIDGRYGVELKARVRTPDGLADIRFVGIDGPRWMVRAVFQGPAATDPAAARPLDEALRGLVVDRGGAAMPVREPLPLRLPREVAEQAAAGAASAGGEQSVSTPPVASGSSDSGTDAEPRKPAPAGRGTAAGRRRPSPRPRRG
jgi:uncharacterized protein DUF3710